jgi:hypothetical protein
MIAGRKIFLLLLLVTFGTTISGLSSKARAAPADEMVRFIHPTGAFSLSIPKSWGLGVPFPPASNVFTFKPPGNAQFTVSITQNLRLPPEFPLKLVTLMFPDERPVSEPVRERGQGWNSIRQDFQNEINGQSVVWLAKFYGFGANAIAITLSDTKDNIGKFTEVFETVTNSIEFHEAQK